MFYNSQASERIGNIHVAIPHSLVKKLELLVVFPDVCDYHENVKTILDKLEVDAVEFSVSADIKMRELIMKIIIM